MRRSYGITTSEEFRSLYHPLSRRFICLDGKAYCRGVMDWFTFKVACYYAELSLGPEDTT